MLIIDVSKILLSEKFKRLIFFAPFPTYELTFKTDFDKMIQQLSLMWETASFVCP